MKKFLGSILLLVSCKVFAGTEVQNRLNILGANLEASSDDFIYNQYYQIHDDPRLQFYNLLSLDVVSEQFPRPAEPYNRDKHFGGWLVDTSGKSCMNTRAFVLVRDSVTPVKMTANNCTVATGTWNDPYTGQPHLTAASIQIDHVVALKNAYMTGGHQWNAAKRCLYANYMGNNFHLLSVDGPQNLKKSDHTPQKYTPPNKAFVCEFLKDWLNIKLIWSLRITPPEGEAISSLAAKNNCDPEKFMVPNAEIQAQRQYMSDNADLCSRAGLAIQRF